MKKKKPWKCPQVHPALLKFKFLRMMSDAELDKMGVNYNAIGLLFPIVIFVDNSGEARGEKGPWPKYLLAGRNRLEMLKRVGITDPRDAKIASSNFYGAIQEVHDSRVIFP